MKNIAKGSKLGLEKDLPKISFEKDKSLWKENKSRVVFISQDNFNNNKKKKILELLHYDLFSSSKTTSIGAKKHDLVIIGDYSRFT